MLNSEELHPSQNLAEMFDYLRIIEQQQQKENQSKQPENKKKPKAHLVPHQKKFEHTFDEEEESVIEIKPYHPRFIEQSENSIHQPRSSVHEDPSQTPSKHAEYQSFTYDKYLRVDPCFFPIISIYHVDDEIAKDPTSPPAAQFEENYQKFVDLDSLPKCTRNQLLCQKVSGLISSAIKRQVKFSKDFSFVERKVDSKVEVQPSQPVQPMQPSPPQKTLNNSNSKRSSKCVESELKLIPLKKNQKPIKFLIRPIEGQEIKILYKNEWFYYDISMEIHKLKQMDKSPNSSPPKQRKRGPSPLPPDTIVREIYQEFGLVSKDANVILDWKVQFENGYLRISPLPQQKKKDKQCPEKTRIRMCLYIEFEINHTVDFSKSNFNSILTYLGLLISDHILIPSEMSYHKNSTQDTMAQENADSQTSVEGRFTIRQIVSSLSNLSELLIIGNKYPNYFGYISCSESLWKYSKSDSKHIFDQKIQIFTSPTTQKNSKNRVSTSGLSEYSFFGIEQGKFDNYPKLSLIDNHFI